MTSPHEKPHSRTLAEWGEQLRQDKRRRRRRIGRAAVTGLGLGLVLGSILWSPAPRLVWNASASAPVGLYRVHPGWPVQTGDRVIAAPPQAMRDLAARRGYLPRSAWLVKSIAAGPGDRVCALYDRVVINDRLAAERRVADGQGRPMPWWQGCHTLHDRQYFLLMPPIPASFDGRYFGITNARDIVGPARLLWAPGPRNPGR